MDALLTNDALLLSRLPHEINEIIMSALDDKVNERTTNEDLTWLLLSLIHI